MKKSLLRVSRFAVILLVAGLLAAVGADAQSRHKAAKKKVKHRHVRVITHHSDNDKQLELIKKEKNKQKGIK